MINKKIKKFFINDYYGLILSGSYSNLLKKRVSNCISNFLSLDSLGSPFIPYISAWREDRTDLWYEFTGSKLRKLLDCSPTNVAEALRNAIVDRSIYNSPIIEKLSKEVLAAPSLHDSRRRLRKEAKQNRVMEAVYKLSTPDGHNIWFKDQANIEFFPQDRICLSLGMLCDVSKEMRAEEELKKAKEELRQHRDQLNKLVRSKTLEISKTRLEIIYRLSKATECRDKCTGQHITKMSHYSAVIGKKIGLKQDLNKLLFYATPMHDVGKIGISDNILLKPGRLSSNEFHIMQKHSRIGAELLSGHSSKLLRVARNIALTHHEKWDGSGYPQGLQNKDIPVAGRIVAICDVFDALTSERPYKNAWPFEQAVKEIIQCSGSHFDPRLVHAFVNCVPQIKTIYNKNFPPQDIFLQHS